MKSLLLLDKVVNDGQRDIGKIENICWEKGSPCVLQIDGKFFVAEKIYAKEKVFLTNAQERNITPTLIGKYLFDNYGKKVGVVTEIEITRSLKLKKITLDNEKTLTRGQLLANNDVIIAKIEKCKKTEKRIATAEKPCDTQSQQRETTTNVIVNPKRRYGDFSFLVGKQVDKTITNFAGEVMIKRGEYVTREVFVQAKKFGKLTELCLHTENDAN